MLQIPENCKLNFSSIEILAEVKENIASESSCFAESASDSILFNNLLKNFNTWKPPYLKVFVFFFLLADELKTD